MSLRRVALVHDWLTGMRGGEKVLEVLCDLFPAADIFTLVHIPGKVSPTIERHRIICSPLQKLPGVGEYYRHLLPVMPWAIERMDLTGYDLVISSSHCVAKGVRVPKRAVHVCYCHTPMRYIWDQFNDYFGQGAANPFVHLAMRSCRPALQKWDRKTAANVNTFIANSHNVQNRIKRLYGRDSDVIYPPVDYGFYGAIPDAPLKSREDFYLVVSALAPYKRLDLALDAFAQLGRRLVVIGEGQDHSRLRAIAGPTVEFLGWRSNAELRSYYQRARGLIFPGLEDFGIVPLEAMATGCPVIAYAKGGALETVVEGKTGTLFRDQSVESLAQAVSRFETTVFDASVVQGRAQEFGQKECEKRFRRAFVEYKSEMS